MGTNQYNQHMKSNMNKLNQFSTLKNKRFKNKHIIDFSGNESFLKNRSSKNDSISNNYFFLDPFSMDEETPDKTEDIGYIANRKRKARFLLRKKIAKLRR